MLGLTSQLQNEVALAAQRHLADGIKILMVKSAGGWQVLGHELPSAEAAEIDPDQLVIAQLGVLTADELPAAIEEIAAEIAAEIKARRKGTM